MIISHITKTLCLPQTKPLIHSKDCFSHRSLLKNVQIFVTTIKEHWLMQCKIRTIGAFAMHDHQNVQHIPRECTGKEKKFTRVFSPLLFCAVVWRAHCPKRPQQWPLRHWNSSAPNKAETKPNQTIYSKCNHLDLAVSKILNFTFWRPKKVATHRVENVPRLLCNHRSSSGDHEY